MNLVGPNFAGGSFGLGNERNTGRAAVTTTTKQAFRKHCAAGGSDRLDPLGTRVLGEGEGAVVAGGSKEKRSVKAAGRREGVRRRRGARSSLGWPRPPPPPPPCDPPPPRWASDGISPAHRPGKGGEPSNDLLSETLAWGRCRAETRISPWFAVVLCDFISWFVFSCFSLRPFFNLSL